MIDTHAHLHFSPLKERSVEAILAKAKAAGVKTIINVASDLSGSQASLELANKYPEIYATVGIHPHDAVPGSAEQLEQYLSLAKVVAIGECGLDYFKSETAKENQKSVFEKQIELALKYNKPLIIHNREADQDMYAILQNNPGLKIVLHCFSSTLDYAKKYLDLGCYLSFTGNITFPKNLVGQDVLKYAPLERIMLETDCPFLSPVPLRGQPNEPANIPYIASKISELKNISVKEVELITDKNAQEFFTLSRPR